MKTYDLYKPLIVATNEKIYAVNVMICSNKKKQKNKSNEQRIFLVSLCEMES